MAEQRYRVIKRLEAGGMAEVFIGEAQSVQGFKKRVAIKRVLPHLAQNQNFIGMFLDEARLGARLTHANIVSVTDIGAADGTFFIVMEYVEGANLKKIIETLRQQGRPFPFKEAVYICMEACRGLSFAHELEDDAGKLLNIVHRDVSPPNILISKRGEVKVTDFGLAKASTQLEKTDPGVVKGKFSYLAPEAAQGENVDARADLFAMGIVLWEMLAGRRLFLGETDYQTVKLVQQAQVPSLSRLNPEVDAEFEQVLAKALARDPRERYQSAREMGDALAGYLFGHQLKVTSYDIANLVKATLAQEKPEASTVQAGQQSIIDKLIQEELLRFTSLDDFAAAQPIGVGAEADGAQPLDAGLFENPADWFSDDAEVDAALGAGLEKNTTGSDHGWRESGLEGLAAELEDDGDAEPMPPPPRPSVPSAPPPPKPVDAMPVPAEPAKKGGSGMVIALVVLLLLGAGGAAAYFLTMR
ncbi:MAG: serine/threonine protein kinase [Sandaracinus sp.]|nr:serine/threonine protein kinase [Sandaracinus sp.]